MIVPATSPPDYPIFRLCTRTLASASRLVPASRRFEWRQEWEAEVWHHLQSLIEAGRLTRERQLDLFLRCLGAIRHAAWLRGRSATHRARMSLHELAGEPAWACMLILTLGLTLGTAAAVFDLGWAALTQSSPDSMNDRVVRVWNRAEAAELGRGAVSAGEFVRFERANSTLEHIAAFRRRAMVIDDGTSGMLARGAFVTSDFFAVFGLRLSGAAGGTSAPIDGRGVVLGHDLWRQRFGGDPRVIGRQLTIDGSTHIVTGIAPAEFRFPRGETELWLSFPAGQSPSLGERDRVIVGLLRRGVSRAEAQRDLTGLSLELQRESPAFYFGHFGVPWQVLVDPLSRPGQGFEPILLVLIGGAAIAVLAAVASVSSMAGAGRIRRGPPIETGSAIVCVLTGAGLALTLAASARPSASRLLQDWMPALPPGNLGIAGFCLVAAGAAVALGGIVGVRLDSTDGRAWFRPSLQAIVVAATVILLSGGAGFGESYRLMRHDGPGFRPTGLMAVPAFGRPSDMARLRDRLQRVRGVEAVARGTSLPYLEGTVTMSFAPERMAESNGAPATSASVHYVDSDYFRVLGMQLREGRWLETVSRDAVVSRAMARRFWPAGDAVGRKIMVYPIAGEPGVWVSVVGVTNDVRRGTLGGRTVAEMYVPLVLAPGAPSLVVRTTLGVEELASVAQSTVPGSRVVRMNEQVAGSMLPQGVAAVILGALALLVWASGVLSVYHSSEARPSPAVAAIVGSLVGASAVWWMAPALSDALYRTTIRGAYFFWAVVLLAGGSSLAAAFLPRKPRRALTETP